MVDELTDETRAELDTIESGTPDLERQIRGATVAVETEEAEQRTVAPEDRDADPEDRERLELRGKIVLGRFLGAALEKRAADGAEAEYMAAIDMPLIGRGGGTAFPLELLAPPEVRAARTEERATTNVDVATMPRTWLDRLFAETARHGTWHHHGVGAVGQRVISRDHGRGVGGAASTLDRRGC